MKKLLFLILMVAPSTAHAYLPNGCYVTDGANYCHYAFFNASECDQYMTVYTHGNYIYTMCRYVNEVELDAFSYKYALEVANQSIRDANTKVSSCAAERDNYATANAIIRDQRDTCLGTAVAIAGQRDQVAAASKKQGSLIKKLRKACGARCKKIK